MINTHPVKNKSELNLVCIKYGYYKLALNADEIIILELGLNCCYSLTKQLFDSLDNVNWRKKHQGQFELDRLSYTKVILFQIEIFTSIQCLGFINQFLYHRF